MEWVIIADFFNKQMQLSPSVGVFYLGLGTCDSKLNLWQYCLEEPYKF